MKVKKMFYLFTRDGKQYVDTAKGVKELAEKLDRTESSVWGTISKMKSGKIKHIKSYDGVWYTLRDEEEMFERNQEDGKES